MENNTPTNAITWKKRFTLELVGCKNGSRCITFYLVYYNDDKSFVLDVEWIELNYITIYLDYYNVKTFEFGAEWIEMNYTTICLDYYDGKSFEFGAEWIEMNYITIYLDYYIDGKTFELDRDELHYNRFGLLYQWQNIRVGSR